VGGDVVLRPLRLDVGRIEDVDGKQPLARSGTGGQSQERLALEDANLREVTREAQPFLQPEGFDDRQRRDLAEPPADLREAVDVAEGPGCADQRHRRHLARWRCR
jgi:hypothetical protein